MSGIIRLFIAIAMSPLVNSSNAPIKQVNNIVHNGRSPSNERASIIHKGKILTANLTKKDSRPVLDIVSKSIVPVAKNTSEDSTESQAVRRKVQTTSGVCTSETCRKVAKQISESLNTSADPCEDFYAFSCGGWKAKHDIPSSENEITAFTMLTQEIEKAINELIKEPEQPDESDALKKARKFFKSCMDTETIERLGPDPALKFIKYIGEWALCGNKEWQEESWDVYEILKRLQRNFYPAPPFFTVEVTNDHLNSTKHLIKVCI